jgi:thiosulfate reductase cytochrome b subunit
MPADLVKDIPDAPRHSGLVRVTHWITTIAFLALLVSGLELVISHPRFYWGEEGNSGIRAAFQIPIPASGPTVPTGYKFVLPKQNGWSRYLHFEAAWVAVLTGLVYVGYGLWSRHFRRDILPVRSDRSWQAFGAVIASYWRRAPQADGSAKSYNVVQRASYLVVIFVLFPLMIWTGLAMSPSFTSAAPWVVDLLGGGRQTARTIHFLDTGALSLFVLVHVGMVVHAGFVSRVRAMVTGGVRAEKERA